MSGKPTIRPSDRRLSEEEPQGAGVVSASATIRELAVGPEGTGGLGAIYLALLVTRAVYLVPLGLRQLGRWKTIGASGRVTTLTCPWAGRSMANKDGGSHMIGHTITSRLIWPVALLTLVLIIERTPAFGQVEDVSECASPRTLNLSAMVGDAPTQYALRVNEAIPDCEIEQTYFFNISVTYLNGTGWLSVPPSVTFAPGQANSFTVTVNYAALPGPGVYQALIIVTAPGPDPETGLTDQATIPVTVTLSEPRARLSLHQTTLFYQSVSRGALTRSQTLTISNEGTGTLNWSLSGLPSWLRTPTLSGTATGGAPGTPVFLTADPSSFDSGVRSQLVTVSATGASNNPQLVTVVLLTVPGATPATAEISPNALVFVALLGQPAPPPQTINLSNVGGGTLSFNFTTTITSPPGGSWLSLVGQGGVNRGQVTVSADPSDLPRGLYRATLTGTFGVGLPQEVEVLLIVTPPGTALRALARGLPGAAQCDPERMELLATTIGNDLSLPVSFPRVLTALVVDDCGSALDNATLVASVEGLNIPLRSLGSGFYSGTWVPQSAAASVTVTFDALHPTFAKVQRSFTV